MSNEQKTYSVFRNYFHIPSAWQNHESFQELTQHHYPTDGLTSVIDFVRSALKELGYRFEEKDDEMRMEHDYICHMLADLLRSKGVPFLTEQDFQTKENSDLRAWLNGTPDLFIKGKSTEMDKSNRYIVDVYTGTKDLNKIKANYKQSMASRLCNPLVILHPLNIQEDLSSNFAGGVFTNEDIDYFIKNYRVFQTEAQNWRSCLKTGILLRNEPQNVPIQKFEENSDFSSKLTTWKTKMLGYAVSDIKKLNDDADDDL